MTRERWVRFSALLAAAALVGCGPGARQDPDAPRPEQIVVEPVPEPSPVGPGRAPAEGPYAPGVDVLHYQIELDLRADSDTILGRTLVRFRRTGGDADGITLDLTGLGVDSVRIGRVGSRNLQPVPSAAYRDSLAAGRLPVPFPEGSAVGDVLDVEVRYGGRPDDGLILGRTVHGDPSAFADNWPDRARFWFPSVDHPSDKATATFVVRAPEAWRVVANGAALAPPTRVADTARAPATPGPEAPRRTWRWETRAPIPTYTMVVGATAFSVRRLGLAACGRAPLSPRRDGCVEVSAWLFPEDSLTTPAFFRRAPEMVDFYTDLIGPYPYEKLAHVQAATRFGGMENATAIFYPGPAVSRGTTTEAVVAHETAHQWFGDSVTEADWHHLWLSEGFAEYFEALYYEEAEGPARFRARMEQKRRDYLRAGVSDRPVVDEEVDDLFDLLNMNSYAKGGWVLHMLRGVLGDDAFFRGIREYYERHRDSTALTADFRAVMEEVSGMDLEWFFQQWVFRPGHPVISTDWSWDPAEESARVTIRQEQSASWPTFRLPAEVEILMEGGETRRERVELTRRSEELVVDLPAPPTQVRFDPDGWVLTGAAPGGRPGGA